MSTADKPSTKNNSEELGEQMNVNLQGLSKQLEKRVESRISEFEGTNEHSIMNGGDGVVPRIKIRDYIFEAAVGIVLTLYFVVELFIV